MTSLYNGIFDHLSVILYYILKKSVIKIEDGKWMGC